MMNTEEIDNMLSICGALSDNSNHAVNSATTLGTDREFAHQERLPRSSMVSQLQWLSSS